MFPVNLSISFLCVLILSFLGLYLPLLLLNFHCPLIWPQCRYNFVVRCSTISLTLLTSFPVSSFVILLCSSINPGIVIEHSIYLQDFCLLWRYGAWTGRNLPTLQRNVLPPWAPSFNIAVEMVFFFFFTNVWKLSNTIKMLHSRRQHRCKKFIWFHHK